MTKCLKVEYLFDDEWRTQAWLPEDMPDLADQLMWYMGYYADLGMECRFVPAKVDWM